MALAAELLGTDSTDALDLQEQVNQALTQAQAEFYRRDLREFLAAAWNVFEPKQFKSNWHLDAICDHLAYVSFGDIRNLMINIPPRQTKPESVDCLVPTERGIVRLGDVVIGDRVLTHRGRFREVTAVHEQGEMDLLDVVTISGRSNKAEPTHPFLTPEGWVQAKHLKEGSVLGCPSIPDIGEADHTLQAEAFLAGYFVGDGSTTKNQAVVTCNDGQQIRHMRNCASILGFETSVGNYTTPRVNFKSGVRPWLRDRGLAEKTSHTKTVPDFVLADYRAWKPFLGAYFACDATVSNRAGRFRKDLMFASTTVNETLADQVLMMLGLLGIRAMKRHRVTGDSSFKAGQDYWLVQIQSQQDILKLRERIWIPGIKGHRIMGAPIQRTDFDHDLIPDPVDSVTPAGRGECRCLTVEEDHSFVADGIAVSNSLTASVAWPVWHWLLDPKTQFLFASYAQDLAIRDAVKSRRLIESAWFRERYGDVFYLDPTDNRKHRYINNHGGHRISTSVGGKTTGEGGDIIGIDDPHNMKDVYSDTIRHGGLTWWDNSMRSRLNDPTTGQKVLIGQRSHDADLFGHILQTEDERWEVLMLPMEYDPARHCVTFFNKGRGHQTEKGKVFEDPRTKKGELLNPQRFGQEEKKAEIKAMAQRDYSAQFNQDPTSGGGLILKKKWWQQWVYPPDHPQAGQPMPLPEFFEIVSVYDTAFEEDEEHDFSARVTAGLFEYSATGREQDTTVHAMLLERLNERLEFPDLKTEAIGHHTEWSPDRTLIEKKASGHSLIQEMRRAGVPLWGVNPGSNDKIFRAHMVAQILKEGRVWYIPRNWAHEVITQCAKFPVGEHDDLVDCVVMLLAYIRRMGLVELPDDERDDEMNLFAKPKRKFYGS